MASLPAWIDPGSCAAIVVDKVRSPLRRESLFPSCRQAIVRPRRRRCRAHGSSLRWCVCWPSAGDRPRACVSGLEHIIRQDTPPRLRPRGLYHGRRLRRTIADLGSVPSCAARVVIDIVLPPHWICADLPSWRQRPLLISELRRCGRC